MILKKNHHRLQFLLALVWWTTTTTSVQAFHDCIQTSRNYRKRRRRRWQGQQRLLLNDDDRSSSGTRIDHYHHYREEEEEEEDCSGGICIGMTNGPHQGGNASYPVAWNGNHGTYVEALMTVPPLPQIIDSSMTYYLWTDLFFGDLEYGRMNQFVPQLILGSALDGSSGPPDYQPIWSNVVHKTWSFAAHYFFELESSNAKNETEAHAAYGTFYPAYEGETLRTTFELLTRSSSSSSSSSTRRQQDSSSSSPKRRDLPYWKLTMEIVGTTTTTVNNNPPRRSTLEIDQPYMGMRDNNNIHHWLESPFRNMCINSCWELYGATNASKLPNGGATYQLDVVQPTTTTTANDYYNFTTWERDEGNGQCPSVTLTEWHNRQHQRVWMDIHVDGDSTTTLVQQ